MSSVLFREFVVFECAADVARYIRATEIVKRKGKVASGVYLHTREKLLLAILRLSSFAAETP